MLHILLCNYDNEGGILKRKHWHIKRAVQLVVSSHSVASHVVTRLTWLSLLIVGMRQKQIYKIRDRVSPRASRRWGSHNFLSILSIFLFIKKRTRGKRMLKYHCIIKISLIIGLSINHVFSLDEINETKLIFENRHFLFKTYKGFYIKLWEIEPEIEHQNRWINRVFVACIREIEIRKLFSRETREAH